jgi:AcrR family transcriptional regulator
MIDSIVKCLIRSRKIHLQLFTILDRSRYRKEVKPLGAGSQPPIDESTGLRSKPLNGKQEQILQGAMQVFLSHGYAGTSMDRVAAASNVSKQTIYSYFQDKEGLFTALIERITIHRLQQELGCDELQGDPEILLRQLAIAFFNKIGNEEYLNLFRVVVGESVRFPELAKLYSRTVIQRGRGLLTAYFRSHPELQIADPEATAQVFLGSLVAFVISQKVLYGEHLMPIAPERLVETLIPLILSQRKPH